MTNTSKSEVDIVREAGVQLEHKLGFLLKEVTHDDSSALLLTALKQTGFVSAHIDSYNNFIGQEINQIISDEPIITNNVSDPSSMISVSFSNPVFEKPSRSITRSGIVDTVPQLPHQAREEGETYRGKLTVNAQITVYRAGEQKTVERRIHIGDIPVMIGSYSCTTSTMTDQELASKGEIVGPLKGYFVVRGVRKYIILQERSSENMPLIYAPKSGARPVLRYNGSRLSSSYMMTLNVQVDKQKQSRFIHYLSPCFKTNMSINVLLLFRMLWIPQAKVEHWIKILCPEKKRQRAVFNELTSSFLAAYYSEGLGLSYPDPSLYSTLRTSLKDSIIDEYGISEAPSIYDMSRMIEIIMKEVCFNITDSDPHICFMKKLMTLLDMLIKYCEHLRGLRKQDDRDKWPNKVVRAGGKTCSTLFAHVWRDGKAHLRVSLRSKTLTGTIDDYIQNIESEISSIFTGTSKNSTNITKIFEDSFGVLWGAPNGRKIENVTDELKVSNVALSLSLLTRISVPVNSSAVQQQIREIQPTQFGFIDYIKSPEGEKIGLIKHLALLCSLSLDIDDTSVKQLLKVLSSVDPQTNQQGPITPAILPVNDLNRGWSSSYDQRYTPALVFGQADQIITQVERYADGSLTPKGYSFAKFYNFVYNLRFGFTYEPVGRPLNPLQQSKIYYNGELIGFANAEQLREYFVTLRRGINEEGQQFSAAIPYFTSVYYQRKEDCLQIRTDSSRVIRPVLVVNKKNELLIDKYNGWSMSFMQLRQNGFIEYIDSGEQEYCVIAMSIEKFREGMKKIKEAEEEYQKLRSEYSSLVDPERQLLDLSYLKEKLAAIEASQNDQTSTSEIEKLKQEINRLETVEKLKDLLLEKEAVLANTIKRNTFTHVEIDPMASLGVSAALILWAGTNAGPRNAYESVQGTQALSYGVNNFWNSSEDALTLAEPSRPLVETSIYKAVGMDALPTGKSVILAIMSYDGWGQEDALILKKQAIERGLFKWINKNVYKEKEINKRIIRMPDADMELKTERSAYMKLDPTTGLPKRGALLIEGDIAIGMVLTDAGRKVDVSIIVERGRGGKVIDVIDTRINHIRTVKIVCAQYEDLHEGDKFSSRIAQKATEAIAVNEWDLPFTSDGMTPDIICNPHAITSRMTYGMLMEVIASKVVLMTGQRINGDSFRSPKEDMEEFQKILIQNGFSPSGKRRMTSGITGKPLEAEIFIGPCYYRLLSHLVLRKMQARSTGRREQDTRQPVGGKRKKGGSALKIGEMERDALISFGAEENTNELLCTKSDAFDTVICKTCKQFCTLKPNGTECQICKKADTGVRVKIPYAYLTMTDILRTLSLKAKFNIKPKGIAGTVRIDADLIEEDDEEEEGSENEEDEEEAEEVDDTEVFLADSDEVEDQEQFYDADIGDW